MGPLGYGSTEFSTATLPVAPQLSRLREPGAVHQLLDQPVRGAPQNIDSGSWARSTAGCGIIIVRPAVQLAAGAIAGVLVAAPHDDRRQWLDHHPHLIPADGSGSQSVEDLRQVGSEHDSFLHLGLRGAAGNQHRVFHLGHRLLEDGLSQLPRGQAMPIPAMMLVHGRLKGVGEEHADGLKLPFPGIASARAVADLGHQPHCMVHTVTGLIRLISVLVWGHSRRGAMSHGPNRGRQHKEQMSRSNCLGNRL